MTKSLYLRILCIIGFLLFLLVFVAQLLLVFLPNWKYTALLWVDVATENIQELLNVVVYLECFIIVPMILIGLVMLFFGSSRGAWMVLQGTIMVAFLDFIVHLLVLGGFQHINNWLNFWLAMAPYIIWYILMWIELGRKRRLLLASPQGVISALEEMPRSE